MVTRTGGLVARAVRLAATVAVAVAVAVVPTSPTTVSAAGAESVGAGVTDGSADEAEAAGPVDFFSKVIGLQADAAADTRSKGLRVIGAGNSKTGTKSLTMALQTLGHKVYDIQAIMGSGHLDLLERVVLDDDRKPIGLFPPTKDDARREAALDEFYDAIMEFGATATLDSPMNFFYEDLLARNPDAKVILSVHPSGDANMWVRSLSVTWDAFAPLVGRPLWWLIDMHTWNTGVFPFVGCTNELVYWSPWWAPWIKYPSSHFDKQDECAQRGYVEWNQRVHDHVPAGQLLEFSPAHGWAPLCEFLDVAAADCPDAHGIAFPHANARSENDTIRLLARIIAVAYPVLAVLPLLLLWACCRCCGCCCRGGDRKGTHAKRD